MYKNFCYTYTGEVNDDLISRMTVDFMARQEVLGDSEANSSLKLQYQMEAGAFDRVFRRVSYSSAIFYDSGWRALLEGGLYPICLLGSFLVMLSPLFSYEYEHEVWQITCSTKKRTSISKSKVGAVFSVVSALYIVYYVFEFFIISKVYDLPNREISVKNIFINLLFDTSLIQYAILQKVIMLVGIVAIVLCFICIALYIKNTILTIVFGVIVLSVAYITRIGLVYPNGLFVEGNNINIASVAAGAVLLCVAIVYLMALAIRKNI